MIYKYHKIPAPFERDMEGTKKLIEGKYISRTLETMNKHKVPFEWTEKIDGTNIRVLWNGHNVEFGGRTDKAQIPEYLLKKLQEIFCNNETEELFEQLFGEKQIMFIGEGYGNKIQKVGAEYRDDVSFILFDIYAIESECFLDRKDVEELAKTFGLEIVDIVLTGTIDDAIDFIRTRPKSHIGNADMEGLVGRPIVEINDRLGHRVITKVKVKDFC